MRSRILVFSFIAIWLIHSGWTVYGLHEDTICPWFANATFTQGTTVDMGKIYHLFALEMEQACTTIPYQPDCYYNQLVRHACFQVHQRELGIVDVDPNLYFPELSYHQRIALPPHLQLSFSQPKDLRIAYLLLFHQNLEQLKRLVHTIYHPYNVYVIHVDKKVDNIQEVRNFALQYRNIAVVERRFDIAWGSVEMVYATLEGLFTLLDVAEWDFVINLSAADYPLCTEEELTSILSASGNMNFDASYKMGDDHHRKKEVCMTCGRRVSSMGLERPALNGIEIHGSAQWFVYHRSFVEYLRHSSMARVVLAYYETWCVPDEGYFATVLMNSPFAHTLVRNNLRYYRFHSSHPDILGVQDFPELVKTKACFARKFDPAVDGTVLDLIDEWRSSKPSQDKRTLQNYV